VDDLEKSLPFAEGMISAADGSKNIRAGNERTCLNCGTSLTDAYCPHCGQKDLPKRQTLGELLSNFISSFWSFESKFFNSGFLLLKPGFLAIEYTAGRRERYYHPARMYVFISFVYFLLVTALPDDNVDPLSDENDITITDDWNDFTPDPVDFTSREQYDSIQQALQPEERDSWMTRVIRKREIILRNKYKDNMAGFVEDIEKSYVDNFPKIVFFLLPVFATLFKLLYIRKDFYFSEHLVFSIYYYNFFFLAGSVYLILDLVSALDLVTTLLGFWIALYLLFAMKKMYRQSWRKTVFKYCIFLGVFSVCIGVGIVLNLMVSLLLI
jgi:hypothetical protein